MGNRLSKIATRTGDDGSTGLGDGSRTGKDSARIHSLGEVDELNSFVGLAKVRAASGPDPKISLGKRSRATSAILGDIQETLFIVQAEIAGAPKRVGKAKVTQAEFLINTIEGLMPPITTFTVAGGTDLSATLDVTRTLARRAERRVIGVTESGLRKVAPNTKAYLNRLSSLLFALARYANQDAGIARQAPKYK
jgi:cob(I)alamin adenosyltransferase